MAMARASATSAGSGSVGRLSSCWMARWTCDFEARPGTGQDLLDLRGGIVKHGIPAWAAARQMTPRAWPMRMAVRGRRSGSRVLRLPGLRAKRPRSPQLIPRWSFSSRLPMSSRAYRRGRRPLRRGQRVPFAVSSTPYPVVFSRGRRRGSVLVFLDMVYRAGGLRLEAGGP